MISTKQENNLKERQIIQRYLYKCHLSPFIFISLSCSVFLPFYLSIFHSLSRPSCAIMLFVTCTHAIIKSKASIVTSHNTKWGIKIYIQMKNLRFGNHGYEGLNTSPGLLVSDTVYCMYLSVDRRWTHGDWMNREPFCLQHRFKI